MKHIEKVIKARVIKNKIKRKKKDHKKEEEKLRFYVLFLAARRSS